MTPRRVALASTGLSMAIVAMPLGFLLGGAFAHAGDPGAAIVLVPAGGVGLLVAAVTVAIGVASP